MRCDYSAHALQQEKPLQWEAYKIHLEKVRVQQQRSSPAKNKQAIYNDKKFLKSRCSKNTWQNPKSIHNKYS